MAELQLTQFTYLHGDSSGFSGNIFRHLKLEKRKYITKDNKLISITTRREHSLHLIRDAVILIRKRFYRDMVLIAMEKLIFRTKAPFSRTINAIFKGNKSRYV